MKLSNVVTLNQKIARSVNLERDKSDLSVINSYYITEKAQEVIGRLVAAMEDEKVSAWSLVGPYGMGKSAFLNYLLALTGPDDNEETVTAFKKLNQVNTSLHDTFSKQKASLTSGKGFFQVSVVAAFEPINTTLARGLLAAVNEQFIKNKASLIPHIKEVIETGIESYELMSLFKDVSRLAEAPLLIMIDELGKNLEYLSYQAHNGDLFILQQLAEMNQVYLFVSLHQSFGEYLAGFSATQQQEWNKIQGRFEEISYLESVEQAFFLIKSIIQQKHIKGLSSRIHKWAVGIGSALEQTDISGKEYLDTCTISSLYPLHPLTGLVLVELCRRYAQNERTLVSFLTSGHMFALPAKMERIKLEPQKNLPSIGLDSLYDYFFQLSHGSSAHRPSFQRWVEIHDTLQSTGQLSSEETLVLKNIGVLNLLAGAVGIKASFAIVSSLMEFSYDWSIEKTQNTLDLLSQRGVLFYREYAQEYRLWEGSNFDINGAIFREKAKLSIGSLDTTLESSLPLSPIIATRYSVEKGIVRRYERRWLDSDSVSNKLAPQEGTDGLLIYCFGTGQKPLSLPKECSDKRPLIVAYAPVKETLEEIVLELVACQRVLESYPQLIHDKVARKEVSFRLRVARERFREYLTKAFTPGSPGLVWYAEGVEVFIPNRRELSKKLSEQCKKCYYSAPTILNEIISGENISNVAVRARRELVEAMVTKASSESLGFSGWGPEVAIYRSLILFKDLHKKNPETGSWYLSLDSDDDALNEVWEELDKLIEKADDRGSTVEEMLNKLRECPFGLKQGPALIYISLYLSVKAETLTVFREGTYNPYLTTADMALLLKRPELFTVKRFVTNDMQDKIFAVYRAVLAKSQLKVDKHLRNASMLGVIGPLMKFVDQLPRYTKQTLRVSQLAQNARATIANAVDPLKFLFEDLPLALEVENVASNAKKRSQALESSLRMVIKELGSAYEKLNFEVQQVLLTEFAFSSMDQLYSTQRKVAKQLIPFCEAKELRPILQALSREEASLDDWVKGIAGAVVKKPTDAWRDDDLVIFEARFADYADKIKQLQALAALDQSADVFVITVMGSGGKVKRDVVTTTDASDDMTDVIDGFMKLSEERRRAVLAILANKTMLGG